MDSLLFGLLAFWSFCIAALGLAFFILWARLNLMEMHRKLLVQGAAVERGKKGAARKRIQEVFGDVPDVVLAAAEGAGLDLYKLADGDQGEWAKARLVAKKMGLDLDGAMKERGASIPESEGQKYV